MSISYAVFCLPPSQPMSTLFPYTTLFRSNSLALFIPVHQSSEVVERTGQQGLISRWLDEGTLTQRMPEPVCWHKELRVTKGFQWTQAQDNQIGRAHV